MMCLYVLAKYLIFAVHNVDRSIVSDIRAVSMTAKDTAGLIANNAEAMQDEKTVHLVGLQRVLKTIPLPYGVCLPTLNLLVDVAHDTLRR